MWGGLLACDGIRVETQRGGRIESRDLRGSHILRIPLLFQFSQELFLL